MSPLCAAAAPLSGPYISVGGGANVLQDEITHPYGAYGPGKRSYEFDVGPVGDVAVGFGFGNGLRVEIEGDISTNRVSGVRFPSGIPGRASGTEPQWGGFGNVLYDLRLGLPVVPYLGIGAGYQDLELRKVSSNAASAPLGTATRSPDSGAFAYQGIAGLSYDVAAVPGLAIGIEYHLMHVDSTGPYNRGLPFGDHIFVNGVQQFEESTLHNIFNHQVLFGVRYAFGGAAAPGHVVTQSSAPMEAPAPAASRTYLIFFDWDRADLTERARQIVAAAADASTRGQSTRIEVNGYTDLSGTRGYNQRLSIRRAEAVKAELVSDGVGANEIVIHGYGESNPLVPTAQGVREPQNRRVEIIIR